MKDKIALAIICLGSILWVVIYESRSERVDRDKDIERFKDSNVGL